MDLEQLLAEKKRLAELEEVALSVRCKCSHPAGLHDRLTGACVRVFFFDPNPPAGEKQSCECQKFEEYK